MSQNVQKTMQQTPDKLGIASIKRCLLLTLLCVFYLQAHAGVRIEFEQRSQSRQPGKPARNGEGRFLTEIDGMHFRLLNLARGQVSEVSEDDGAHTRFDPVPAGPHADTNTNTPLLPERGGLFDPLVGSMEDEHIKISPPVPAANWNGYASQRYQVELRYTMVMRAALVFTRRFVHTEQYEITVADIPASASVMRLALTRGYGRTLGLHPHAFLGFPVKIEGQLRSHDVGSKDAAGDFMVDMTLQARSISAWQLP
ncbi:hypothetical protein H8L32_25390 [Undibacterium sp. CY18W]|uniref:Uncharacterized protein n=1 Tax=Undibacterium hunanense TaxID=2762292 RepID=A0ABR6ZY78_9BURK|nr:hypothetical protein [Undibacterium hunanense]MBC3920825.1 hypothetical protein [Undibacterium hunanense]